MIYFNLIHIYREIDIRYIIFYPFLKNIIHAFRFRNSTSHRKRAGNAPSQTPRRVKMPSVATFQSLNQSVNKQTTLEEDQQP